MTAGEDTEHFNKKKKKSRTHFMTLKKKINRVKIFKLLPIQNAHYSESVILY